MHVLAKSASAIVLTNALHDFDLDLRDCNGRRQYELTETKILQVVRRRSGEAILPRSAPIFIVEKLRTVPTNNKLRYRSVKCSSSIKNRYTSDYERIIPTLVRAIRV